MSQQYLRRANLILSSNQGGLDVSQLHFTFQTTQFTYQQGNICEVRLYNLDERGTQRVEGEFTDLTLKAGYEDDPPAIFQGTIMQVRRGWEGDRAEPYIDITAMDGDKLSAYGIINYVAEAGSTYRQRWAAIANAYKVPLDHMPEDSEFPKEVLNQMPRGYTMFGNATDVARDHALEGMSNWSLRTSGNPPRTALVVVAYDGYLSNIAVELNAATGMIGWPEQNDEGISVKCLLNPRLSCDGLVKLNNATITQSEISLVLSEYASKDVPGISRPIIDADGVYKIIFLEHNGDTRGNEFYSHLMCLSVDPSQLPFERALTAGHF
jgi:baseplate hub protein gp41